MSDSLMQGNRASRRGNALVLACACVVIALAFLIAPTQAVAANELATGEQASADVASAGAASSEGAQLSATSSKFSVKATVRANPEAQDEDADMATSTKVLGPASTVKAKFVGNTRYLFLPSFANLKDLGLSNLSGGKAVYVSSKKKGTYQKVSSRATIDVSKFKRSKNGARILYVKQSKNAKPVVVKVMKSANVRAVFLKSADPAKKGRSYIERSRRHTAQTKGSMTLVTAAGDVVYNGKLSQIRGRGNSTWVNAKKKGYQIKLKDKTSLLDGTKENKAKTWVLLANAFDATFMRNYLALKLARAVGMEETPDCEFADLYYDGEYLGNYLLAEKAQIKGGRVDVTEQENESTDKKSLDNHGTAQARNKYGKTFKYVKGVKTPKNITGGYLIELDNGYYYRERCWFRTSIGTFVVKSPDNASKAQMKYISEFTQAAINDLKSGKASKRVDFTALARAHLVNELCKSPDYIRYSSTYFYKDKGNDKLHAGPAWDFDIAFGVHGFQANRSYVSPYGYATAGFANFYTHNKKFKSTMKRVFKTSLLPQARRTIGKNKKGAVLSITQVKKQIAKSVAMERTFRSVDRFGWVTKKFKSWSSSLTYTRGWLTKRLNWMKNDIL